MDSLSPSPKGPVQAASLDLLRMLDETCRQHGLTYTLVGETLLGQVELGTFLPSQPCLDVALLWEDYTALLDILRRELPCGGPYYLLDAGSCEQYDAPCARLMKRSRVRLPEGRERDVKYYDYYLAVHPLFYAGDTPRAYRAFARAFQRYEVILNARLVSRDAIRVKYWLKALRMRYLHGKRRDDTYVRMMEHAARYARNTHNAHNTHGVYGTRFVYLSVFPNARGPALAAAAYRSAEDATFCGVRCMRVTGAREWLDACYAPKKARALLDAPEVPLAMQGPEARRGLQMIQLDMLCEVDRICSRHGIRYGIAFGTMLGAMRHGGIIPWDDDIDVVMPWEDYKRFIETARREMDPDTYFLRTIDNDKDMNISYTNIKRQGTSFVRKAYEKYDTHPGIFIDIFPLFNGPGNIVTHCFRAAVCRYYRVALWAHMGAGSVKSPIWRFIYGLMARMGNREAYARFMRWATGVKRDHGLLMYMGGTPSRIPFNEAYVRKEAYEDMERIPFEGRMLSAAHFRDETMRFFYTEDYMRYPPLTDRFGVRIDGRLDLGDYAP